MTFQTRRRTALRWLKFNLVGALGIGVQLPLLAEVRLKNFAFKSLNI
jgi:hypothetical protein